MRGGEGSVAGDKDLQLELLCSTKNKISISMKKAGDHEIAHEVRGGLVLMRLKIKLTGGASGQLTREHTRPKDLVEIMLATTCKRCRAVERQ